MSTKLPFIRDYTKAGFTKSHVNDLCTKEKLRAKARFESGVGRVHQASQIRVICEIRGCYIFRVYSWLYFSAQSAKSASNFFVPRLYFLLSAIVALHLSRVLYKFAPFYAKQTQFAKKSSERKAL